MNPPITTLSPVCTKARVLMLPNCAGNPGAQYLPPVFEHSSISAPNDHFTAGPDCRVPSRAVGALVVLVAVQLFVLGLYLPPVLAATKSRPRRSFHCRSRLPCDSIGQWAR